MSVLDVFVYVWGAWGMDGGWMPLPTRPQRYCDPASLVSQAMVFGGALMIFMNIYNSITRVHEKS